MDGSGNRFRAKRMYYSVIDSIHIKEMDKTVFMITKQTWSGDFRTKEYVLDVDIPIDTQDRERYRMELLIEGYINSTMGDKLVPMDVMSLIFLHRWDLKYERKVVECQEIFRKIKWIKRVNNLRGN